MSLRLSDEQADALRAHAEEEDRSMQEVVRTAVDRYVSSRDDRLRSTAARVREEDAELLERLGR